MRKTGIGSPPMTESDSGTPGASVDHPANVQSTWVCPCRAAHRHTAQALPRRCTSVRFRPLHTSAAQQHFHGHRLQNVFMGRLQPRFANHAGIVRLLPPVDAHAPAIARLQTGKAIFRPGRDEIVAQSLLMLEKIVAKVHADRVLANVLRPCVALPVPVETSQWICAASLQNGAQYILDHNRLGYRVILKM